jgi:hypothetical protein
LSKIVGEKWRALSADEKKEYEDKAKAKVHMFSFRQPIFKKADSESGF